MPDAQSWGCPCAPGCLLLTASAMGCPCSPQGVASPHCTLAVLNHVLRISAFFATPSPVFPCMQVPIMCFLWPYFQLLLLEVCALLPPASFTVHHSSPSSALILVLFLPSFLLYDFPSLCLLKCCNLLAF